MARAKRSGDKTEAEALKAEDAPKPTTADPTEHVSDGLIMEDADQDGVPESGETAASEIHATEKAEEGSAEPAVASDPIAAEPAAKSGGGGIFPMILGGVIAAAIGYGLAVYLGDAAWPPGERSSRLEDLTSRVAGQADQVEAIRSDVSTLQEDLAAAEDGGDETLAQDIEALNQRMTEMDQRLADVENRPIPEAGAGNEAVAAYEEQLAGMRAMFEQELERIRSSQADAEAAGQNASDRAEAAALRAGLAQVQAAIDGGSAYVEPLNRLSETGMDVPPGLAESAETGVPTLSDLQRDFPAAARSALNASIKVQSDAGQIDPLAGFLKMQLGTRSLEPREGDDPDAILSRAEAALRDGNIARSLSELEALPEAGASAMSEWVTRANARNDAVTAVAALSDQLNN